MVKGGGVAAGAGCKRSPGISTDSLVCSGKLVLENNVFEFDEKLYWLKLGTAIGTKFAPAKVNMFINSRILEGFEIRSWVWQSVIILL